jgi:hypothetical protein
LRYVFINFPASTVLKKALEAFIAIPLQQSKFPVIFNLPLMVVLIFNVIKPETFNVDENLVSFLKVELPLTCNIPSIFVLLDIVVIPETFNEDMNAALPLKVDS